MRRAAKVGLPLLRDKLFTFGEEGLKCESWLGARGNDCPLETFFVHDIRLLTMVRNTYPATANCGEVNLQVTYVPCYSQLWLSQPSGDIRTLLQSTVVKSISKGHTNPATVNCGEVDLQATYEPCYSQLWLSQPTGGTYVPCYSQLW
ncbi:hypothetical protein ElyMa_000068700 [Elysia marginata]|uniref:Uncharacterized protein n=1 Tax=Elysia marginata TaxID=1093978 RepID=A0AAV4EH36_9GAST|nr:hypothetical protein ElyMa_000068700 [Elysia marginata]